MHTLTRLLSTEDQGVSPSSAHYWNSASCLNQNYEIQQSTKTGCCLSSTWIHVTSDTPKLNFLQSILCRYLNAAQHTKKLQVCAPKCVQPSSLRLIISACKTAHQPNPKLVITNQTSLTLITKCTEDSLILTHFVFQQTKPLAGLLAPKASAPSFHSSQSSDPETRTSRLSGLPC